MTTLKCEPQKTSAEQKFLISCAHGNNPSLRPRNANEYGVLLALSSVMYSCEYMH